MDIKLIKNAFAQCVKSFYAAILKDYDFINGFG